MTLRRVLIANRGEIAVRIIRACRESRIESIAVYSDADEKSLHARLADRAIRIGPPAPGDSYLSIPRLIEAARSTRADAIHPGYGFLSERAEFARGCEEAGIVFIGPPAAVIEKMGSKIAARELMQSAGVPVVPGQTPADQTDEGVLAAAKAIGFPVLVKASAGGGGKGMRALTGEAGAREAVQSARRESAASFGDGTLYVERLVQRPRHVEIQVLADNHGDVVHLFERECSLQRRHQKVIEETPSVAIDDAVRVRMGDAAVAAARACGYRNAGTIEFLVEGSGKDARFYFLEMNTRLQVEHPVTEQVVGVDLVRAQLAVAAGAALPWTQTELGQRGHAIECRVYAEDPANGFLPQAGRLLLYREPAGPGIRVDSGFVEGDTIAVNYDPLIAKLIASAETRTAAIERASAALRAFPVLGIRTNIAFLLRLLEDPAFRRGDVHTGYIDEHLAALNRDEPPALEAVAAAALASHSQAVAIAPAAGSSRPDPWSQLGGWGR